MPEAALIGSGKENSSAGLQGAMECTKHLAGLFLVNVFNHLDAIDFVDGLPDVQIAISKAQAKRDVWAGELSDSKVDGRGTAVDAKNSPGILGQEITIISLLINLQR